MKRIKAIMLTLIIVLGLGLSVNSAPQATAPKAPQTVQAKPNYVSVKSLDVVANPYKYLNKHVKIVATFDKFSTLGLDYKPAYRTSEKYISFLIKRDDVKDHTVPLSEMKIFLTREIAEKNIDLNSGDTVEFAGRIFSTALGDAWVDVDEFKVLNRIKTEDKK